MGRHYRGYEQATSDLVEEEEGEGDGDDGEEGGSGDGYNLGRGTGVGGRRVSFGPSSSRVFRPNVREEDERRAEDGSEDNSEDEDDEIPPSFLIEAVPRKHAATASNNARSPGRRGVGSLRPLTSIRRDSAESQPQGVRQPAFSVPLRPSEMDASIHGELPRPNSTPAPKQMRGLDAYERALWNWVNVYNLDAYLQEVSCPSPIAWYGSLTVKGWLDLCLLRWERDILHCFDKGPQPPVSPFQLTFSSLS